ncbi:minor extracellular serine protease Vpr [Evansella vedderi]|uniref:Minor extracellular serine protease Vpr n=1 Tax=Evansella vedderi TaxID=38282 RepID=A0ABT9ZQG3_9BACI|nr:S8 family serine peptidase [Evansella vedderi]MDQ0253089.1 minor extracellular serine protease Vpr [Evansella vedderi]
MRRKLIQLFIYSLVFLLTFSSFGSFGFASQATKGELASIHLEVNESSTDIVTVIVELEEQSVVEAKHNGNVQTKEALAAVRENVIAQVEDVVSSIQVNQEYDYVFSGFSVEIPENEIVHLLGVSGVKAVYPNETYEVATAGDAEFITPEAFSPAMLDSAPFIGSKEAWDAGYKGAGITVAIIDTGVDYTHPDLVHAFGDYKGWDFVDNNDDPQETPPGDPRGGSTNHGTHVAGTVAANGAIKGVAPEATLLAYRVLGPGGSGTTQNVIAGIERAVQDGADIMNLSLGNTLNNPDFATSIALDWAMAEGVVAITSNGNSGPNNWTVGSPGTSRDAISVGATRLPYNKFAVEVTTGQDAEYSSAKVMGFDRDEDLLSLDGKTVGFKAAGFGQVEHFDGDYEGKIAVISRGQLPFVTMAENAKAQGAVGVIVYNHVAGEIPFEIPGMALPTIKMTGADGQQLLAGLEAGYDTVTFEFELTQEVGETMADFSSRGPVMNTWMIKPDVSAPGVAINSTVPTHNPENPHGYASLQGTSMAAPHVAGAAALILEANPDWSPEFVKAALMNTAENLYDENGVLYPHNSQGAGSIRVLDAINVETLVTPGSHSFGIFSNEEDKEVRQQHFTIHNLSDERKRYSISFTGHEGIKVRTSNNLQIQPGRTQDLNFTVQVDAGSLAPGYYEGTFLISDGKQTLEVPTILFVQEPDYPMLNSLNLALSGGNLIGTVNVPGGAEEFNLRIRNADTGALLYETAHATNVPVGTHNFSWNMTIDGQPLTTGRYQINAYARTGTNEFELQGGVLTISEN